MYNFRPAITSPEPLYTVVWLLSQFLSECKIVYVCKTYCKMALFYRLYGVNVDVVFIFIAVLFSVRLRHSEIVRTMNKEAGGG